MAIEGPDCRLGEHWYRDEVRLSANNVCCGCRLRRPDGNGGRTRRSMVFTGHARSTGPTTASPVSCDGHLRAARGFAVGAAPGRGVQIGVASAVRSHGARRTCRVEGCPRGARSRADPMRRLAATFVATSRVGRRTAGPTSATGMVDRECSERPRFPAPAPSPPPPRGRASLASPPAWLDRRRPR